ncbi:MAG: hypothetical protein KC417_06020 [Myxococcales bacterium]|nr:hypothetical protein [Myxococcales bacterium]
MIAGAPPDLRRTITRWQVAFVVVGVSVPTAALAIKGLPPGDWLWPILLNAYGWAWPALYVRRLRRPWLALLPFVPFVVATTGLYARWVHPDSITKTSTAGLLILCTSAYVFLATVPFV